MKTQLFRGLASTFGLMLLVTGMSGTVLAFDTPPVPELDPGSMASALTVVSGALFILRGRRSGK